MDLNLAGAQVTDI